MASDKNPSVADRNLRATYDMKSIRLTGGAHIEQRSPAYFDHFLGATGTLANAIPQMYSANQAGAGTLFVGAATNLSGLLIGATAGTTNNAIELGVTNVAYKASTMAVVGTQGRMWMECRAKFVGTTTASDGDFYIGWADAVTYTNSLPFVISTTSTVTTSVPQEFAGFGYSSIPTSGNLFNSGGNNFIGIMTEKANVVVSPAIAAASQGATGATTNTAKDSNFHIYRVELDDSGNAAFYLDDVFCGFVASAMTASTAVTPYVNAVAKNSHVNTATLDWLAWGADFV